MPITTRSAQCRLNLKTRSQLPMHGALTATSKSRWMRCVARPTILMSPNSLVANVVVLRCVVCSWHAPTSFYSTNRPTTWTLSQLIGWSASSRNTPALSSLLLTTVTSSTMSQAGFLNSTVDADSHLKATTPLGWNRSNLDLMPKRSKAITANALCSANWNGSRCRRRRVKQRVKLVLPPTTSCMPKLWPLSADPTS